MKKYILYFCILIIALQGCDKDDFSWNLPRTNPMDSLQNQNPNNPKWPVASFSASSHIIPLNGIVSFLNTSTQNPTSSFWNFPGGSPATSVESSPSVQYNTIGKFDVKLTVSNNSGVDSITKNDYIEVYYLKSFANSQWDGWINNGWNFSSSPTCLGCIYAWQNTSNNPITYTISKSFSDIPQGCFLEFYYNIYSPGGTIKVKINNVEIWSSSGNGSGNPVVQLPSISNFTLSFEAIIAETQTIYLNDIKIKP